jgi:hypothetical protein
VVGITGACKASAARIIAIVFIDSLSTEVLLMELQVFLAGERREAIDELGTQHSLALRDVFAQ